MKGFVGVRGPGIPSIQEVLLFDSLVMYHADDIIAGYTGDPRLAAELQYLHENEVIHFAPPFIEESDKNRDEFHAIAEAIKASSTARKELDLIEEHLKSVGLNNLSEDEEQKTLQQALPIVESFRNNSILVDELTTRLISIDLRANPMIEAVPLLSTVPIYIPKKSAKTEVVEIILNSLPVLTDDVPWEQVIDFRNDSDARKKLLALRKWMRKVVSEELTAYAIEEELEYLLHDYEQHLQLRKMKFKKGILHTVLTVVPEILENIVKLKLKNVFDPLFTVQQHRIDLIEGELSAPSQEVAYISRVRDEFLR